MNIKVVIIWAFFVVFFAGIGVFGLVNQDLLVEENPNDVYVPSDANNIKSKTCNANLTKGISAYRFQLNEDTDSINKVIMTYTATIEDIDAYTSASNINNTNINGVSTIMSGSTSDFVLIVTVDLTSYDRVAIESIQDDLTNLSMLVDNITDYAVYKNAISQSVMGTTYVCD